MPVSFTQEIERLTQEVEAAQPSDVLKFCAEYFDRRLQEVAAGDGDSSSLLFNTHSFTNGDPTAKGLHTQPHSQSDTVAPMKKFPSNFNAGRRTSVSAESLTPGSFQAPTPTSRTPLPPAKLDRLNKSVSNNFLFGNLDQDSLHAVLNSLQEKSVEAGSTIIRQGDEGDFFYIVESGSVEFWRDNEKVAESGSGSSFGELALMYNAPRAASVVATTDCVLWALDRVTFKKVLLGKTAHKRAMYGEFLRSVPILQSLSSYELSKLADALNSKVYEPGSVVVREGESGNDFFLIESGSAVVSKTGQPVNHLTRGDYFGEVALLRDVPRQATVTAEERLQVATLGRDGFQRLLGSAVTALREHDPTI